MDQFIGGGQVGWGWGGQVGWGWGGMGVGWAVEAGKVDSGGGWEGVGWAVEAGGEPKVGSSMHLSRKAAIVCSLKFTNSHSSLVRPIRLLAAV